MKNKKINNVKSALKVKPTERLREELEKLQLEEESKSETSKGDDRTGILRDGGSGCFVPSS